MAVTTVICSVPVTPDPSVAEAVTVTVPNPVAVKRPVEELIVADPVPFVTDHVTVGLAAFDGRTAAFICRVFPLTTLVAEPAPVTVMLVTGRPEPLKVHPVFPDILVE